MGLGMFLLEILLEFDLCSPQSHFLFDKGSIHYDNTFH